MPIKNGQHAVQDELDIATIVGDTAQTEQRLQYDANAYDSQYLTTQVSTEDVNRMAVADWPTSFVGRFLADIQMEDDPNFVQPWADVKPRYYPYADLLRRANSGAQWEMALGQIEQEIADEEMKSNMTASQWGRYIGWQFLDPISLAMSVATGGLFVWGKGLSVGQATARTAALGGAEATALEGILLMTDPRRDLDESGISILANTMASGLIGAGGQKIVNAISKEGKDAVTKEAFKLTRNETKVARAEKAAAENMPPPDPIPEQQNSYKSIVTEVTEEGADEPTVTVFSNAADETPIDMDEATPMMDEFIDAQNMEYWEPVTTLKEETVRFTPFKPLLHNKLLQTPQTIMAFNGVSPTFSRLGDMFGSNNFYKHGDFTGTRYNGKTVGNEVKMAERRAFRLMTDSTASTRMALRKRGIKASDDDIAQLAGKAARRDARTDEFEPEVWELGQVFRRYLDDWAERGVAVKVLSEKQVEEMRNYVLRMWDMDAVSRKPALFRTKISTWAKNKYEWLTDDQIDHLVDSVKDTLNRINNGENHPMQFHVTRRDPKSGHAKARRIDASDLDIEEFLVSDIRVLSDHYARNLGADIIVREIFGADNIVDVNGLPMPRKEYQQGIREFNTELRALEKSKETGSKLARARAQRKYDRLEKKRKITIKATEDYLRAVMQRPLQQKYPGWNAISRNIRGYSAAAQLGGVVESAFPDPANNILQHGMANVFRALPQFFKSAFPLVITKRLTTARARYWREMDVALDILMSNRMLAVADIEDATKFGMKPHALSGTQVARKAFKLFLADRWNTMVKLLAATTAEKAVVRDARKLVQGKLGKFRSAKATQIGLTKDVAERITKNLDEHGYIEGIPNIDKWDEATVQDFRRLMFRESEFQVVAPDKGEFPSGLDHAVGHLFMQYRGFILSHTAKQLMPASQRLFMGDISVLAGLTAMGSLAIFSQFVKDVNRSFDKDEGFDIDTVMDDWSNKTPMDLAAIAVDRSGMLSFLPEMLRYTDNWFNNELGEAVGMTPRKRYYRAGLGVERQAAGLGYVQTVGQAVEGAVRGALPSDMPGARDYTANDLRKARRSVWFNNTFYLNWLIDAVEEGIIEEAGLPESNAPQKGLR